MGRPILFLPNPINVILITPWEPIIILPEKLWNPISKHQNEYSYYLDHIEKQFSVKTGNCWLNFYFLKTNYNY